MEFIHIIINHQNYLLNSERIKEILKYPTIKTVAESSEHIKGIMSHKDKIIPVIGIRQLLGFESFENEQVKILQKVENQHISWMKDFEVSLKENRPFKKALDPHKCDLGKWIDESLRCMRCNHDGFVDIVKNAVVPNHNALHNDGKKFLAQQNMDAYDKQVETINRHGAHTIKGLHTLKEEIHRLSSSFEQLIIYDIDGVDVGFIVDSVAGLHQFDEKNYNLGSEPLSKSNEFIHFIDHYEQEKDLMFSMKFTREVSALVAQWREKELA